MENTDPRQEAITNDSRAAVTDQENPVAEPDAPAMDERDREVEDQSEDIAEESGEITTMEQLMNNPRHDFKTLKYGDILEGRIMKIDSDEILVDIGSKSEGIIPSKEMQTLSEEEKNELQEGDDILAFVIHSENQEGHSVLSLDRARTERTWRDLEKLFEAGESVETEVASYNKGGLLVNLGGVRGFVPASQVVGINVADELSKQNAMGNLIGNKLSLKIIEINRNRNRLILSQRQAMQEQRDLRKERLLSELHEGQIRHGVVTSICDFGAFVDVGGADGLVHLSELSWSRINHPNEVLKVGDQIDVQVLKVDEAEKKIALSLKRTKPEPWSQVASNYQVGQKVKATITQLASFGAFAKIQDGVEGLIHISELAEGHVAHPRNVVEEGDEVEVCIIRIEPDKRRIGLSLKRAQEENGESSAPAEQASEEVTEDVSEGVSEEVEE